MDKTVKSMGFCCTVGFIKLHDRPRDTIMYQARITKLCPATIKNNRRALREGKLKCQHQKNCMAAYWLVKGLRRPEPEPQPVEVNNGANPSE